MIGGASRHTHTHNHSAAQQRPTEITSGQHRASRIHYVGSADHSTALALVTADDGTLGRAAPGWSGGRTGGQRRSCGGAPAGSSEHGGATFQAADGVLTESMMIVMMRARRRRYGGGRAYRSLAHHGEHAGPVARSPVKHFRRQQPLNKNNSSGTGRPLRHTLRAK